VHFLMQVDMSAVLEKAIESAADDLRRTLRENCVRYASVSARDSGVIDIAFREAGERERGYDVIRRELTDLVLTERTRGDQYLLSARLSDAALAEKRRFAVEQNITALRNRVDELGVAEPVIAQQGQDRIVVQLPGVQDTARAKEILGRTATLEIRLVDGENALRAGSGRAPPGSRIFHFRDGTPILLKNRVIYSGDNIVDAAPGFDGQTGQPI